MASTFDEDLPVEILKQILLSSERILRRFKPIKKPTDFLKNEKTLEKLDSICMQLIAVGESVKNFDKITKKRILINYPEFEWKKAMGMRDIISHHYFDLNSEIVFDVCKNEIPKLKKVVTLMIAKLKDK
jgi:uncharacterized protein with HEPN domain